MFWNLNSQPSLMEEKSNLANHRQQSRALRSLAYWINPRPLPLIHHVLREREFGYFKGSFDRKINPVTTKCLRQFGNYNRWICFGTCSQDFLRETVLKHCLASWSKPWASHEMLDPNPEPWFHLEVIEQTIPDKDYLWSEGSWWEFFVLYDLGYSRYTNVSSLRKWPLDL